MAPPAPRPTAPPMMAPSADTDDGLLKLMRGFNIPITREDYLNLAYMGEPPAALTPEQEEELPPELRRK
jgi:hypothetical protein